MNYWRLFTCAVLVFLVSLSTSAQKDFGKEAEHQYNEHKLTLAVDSFKKAANTARDRQKKAYYTFMVGECYRRMAEPAQAQTFYERAIKLRYDNNEVYLQLADVLKQQGKYEEAQKNYEKFTELTGDPRGKKGVESSKLALELLKNETRVKVQEEQVLNTDDYDFSPTWADRRNEELIFTSNRKGATGEDPNVRTGGGYKDIWITKRDRKGRWGEPVPLDAVINSEHDEGASCMDRRFSTLYFTRCVTDPKWNLGCEIWMSEKKGRGWDEPVKIPLKPEEGDSLAVGHPALTPRDDYLIFAGNLPGGQGGLDLWITSYDDREDKWMEPKNLGPTINTPGNEMFPRVRDNGTLYFSSDGHAGLGGLDIFKAKSTGEAEWGEPENMGVPINSNAHDYGIIYERQGERGFFTSNRKLSSRDDIYRFWIPPMKHKLTCIVLDKDTKEPIEGADILLVGSDNTSIKVQTGPNGTYEFTTNEADERFIKQETNYNIVVEKPTYYLKGSDAITTVDLDKSTHFIKEFLLQDARGTIRLPEIRYDYDEAFLQVNDSVNSKDSLNFLYDLMVDNPTIIVQLMAHTDCRGDDDYNRDLAQRRAQSCVDYLVNEKGIPEERLIPVGKGEDEPIPGLECDAIEALPTKAEREAAHQKNRRTNCKIEAWDYVPKEGEPGFENYDPETWGHGSNDGGEDDEGEGTSDGGQEEDNK